MVLTGANASVVVPIAGPNGTVPATCTLSYVSPPTLGGAFTAAASADGKSIVITLIDIKLLPSSFPINVGYGVRDTASLRFGAGAVSVASTPLPRPEGPSNSTLPGVPQLGVPMAISERDVLAGWSSAGNLPFGLIYAYVTPM